MNNQIRFITNEQGEQVGVFLAMSEYRRLTEKSNSDPELLPGLSENELQALATMRLSPPEQKRLSQLLVRNSDEQLSQQELAELDRLLNQVDHLSILKARALYTLQQKDVLQIAA